MSRQLYALAVFAALALLGCGEPSAPAITETPTNNYRTGEIVWRDLVTVEASSSADFYSNVFGWEITKTDGATPGYFTIKNRGQLIGGILDFPDKNKVDGNEWLSVVSVSDVSEATRTVLSNNGQVLLEKQMVEGRGELAVGVDPSGGILGLLHATGGDPVYVEPAMNDWLWTELFSDDPEAVEEFYSGLGYSIEKTNDQDRDYWILKAGETKVAGMMQNPVENSRSLWLPYVRVEDAAASAERVKRFGGKVLMEPNADVRDGSIAICMDPHGGFFALQEWSM